MRAMAFVLRVIGLAIAFFITFVLSTVVAGISRSSDVSTPADAGAVLRSFLLLSVLGALIFAWLLQRSIWRGAKLMAAVALVIYGLMTVLPQIDSLVYLHGKMPMALISRLFLAGLIQTIIFAPLAVAAMGRASGSSNTTPLPSANRLAVRVAVIAIAYVCLYYLFGYYVAWQSPAVRQFYAGTTELKGFFAQLAGTWVDMPYVLPLQFLRGVLWALIGLIAVRMLRAPRWETMAIVAGLFGVWSFILLAPNPLMPAAVARAHFWETLSCDLLLGAMTGYVLSSSQARARVSVAAEA